MNTPDISSLPPEMQARLAQIVDSAGDYGTPPPQMPTRPPTMMDLLLELKFEVADMREQLAANSQVTEAVGQAVGQIYQMLVMREQQEANTSIEQESTDYYSDDF